MPASALYSAQTQRAVENFPISGDVLDPAQIVALAEMGKFSTARCVCALSTQECGTRTSPIVSCSKIGCSVSVAVSDGQRVGGRVQAGASLASPTMKWEQPPSARR